MYPGRVDCLFPLLFFGLGVSQSVRERELEGREISHVLSLCISLYIEYQLEHRCSSVFVFLVWLFALSFFLFYSSTSTAKGEESGEKRIDCVFSVS